MGKTIEMQQLQFEIIPTIPAMNERIGVYDTNRYIESEKYGTLLGTVITYKGQYLVFCPMEISIHILHFDNEYSLNNGYGESIFDFFMDNDEVIDKMIYNHFINDDLSNEELENIYIKKIIPFIEKEGKLK